MAFGGRVCLHRIDENNFFSNAQSMNDPFWHAPLRAYIKLCLKFYFKKWQVQGLEHVPYDRPVLFVANHQNAFLDALLVLSPLKRMPWFLARADVFKKDWLKNVLSSMHIMPVYRFRDGFNSLKNNEVIFNKSAEILLQNQSLLMFGEGNHGEQWVLRPLQKGFARIAFATELTAEWSSKLCIIPVGIQYEKREDMRSEVLVSYGKPIEVADFRKTYETHPNDGLTALINATSTQMQQLLVHISPQENYDAIYQELIKERKKPSDLVERLREDKALVDKIKLNKIPQEDVVRIQVKPSKWKWVNPILIYGFINNFLTHRLQKFIITKVKDPQFKPSLYFLIAIFIVPLSMLLQASIIHYIFNDWLITIIYAISVPVSGMAGYQFYKE
jgi:1-acyl-sn-glycerol-3-phosphate acyltransferase